MKFSRFAEYLSQLEKTTKRLEISSILAKLLLELDAEETDKAVYLSLGHLGPSFARQEFAIAEKMMIRILSQAYNTTEVEVKNLFEKTGDLGDAAEKLSGRRSEKIIDLTVSEAYDILKEIAEVSGSGSQDLKVGKFSELLKHSSPSASKYLVRIPIGNTRLGFSEITIIEALSFSGKGDKSLKAEIETYFHVYPDIGKIAKLFRRGGLTSLKEVSLEIGVPVLPQLCQRVSTAEEAMEKLKGETGVEYKFDGTRVQLHMDRNRKADPQSQSQTGLFDTKDRPFVKTFTRNLEETTHMFPDLVQAASDQLDAKSVIIDGEAVGYDPKTGKLIPFQETSQRKRKHQIMEKISEIPLKYFVFDILYLNGKPLLEKPFRERRDILKTIVKKGNTIEIDTQQLVSSPQTLLKCFKEARDKGLEGIVMKKLDSKYEAGGRGYSWIKFKREETGGLEDTIDGVILGYYYGRGARARFGIGAFLVGVYDKDSDKFLTTTKVGSGPSDEEWSEIKKRVDKIKVKEKPANVEVKKMLLPDIWAKPEIVVVIRADEITVSGNHTAGYALRFPRLMAFREDKSPKEATTAKEIKHLYKLQKKN